MKYNEIKARLIAFGIERDEARSDALGLIGFIYKSTPAQIMAESDSDYDSAEFLAALERRCNREPLSYITGTRGFMGLDIAVTSDIGNTLIPRPETELIAEYLISHLPKNGRFADLCCGSGCIGVSVCSLRPDVSGICADISEAAVAVTKKNSATFGVSDRLETVLCDIKNSGTLHGMFDIIAANPPYLTTSEMSEISPEVASEPSLALDGGSDGLELVREILKLYPPMLNPGGEMLIEIGCSQGPAALKTASDAKLSAHIIKDLNSLDRVLHITV